MKYTTIVLAVVVGCAVAVVPAQQPTVLANPIECEICRLFEPEFAALAGKDVGEVKAKLDSVCDKIKWGPIAKGCVEFINKELDNIVAALKKDPTTVCTQIHACGGAVENVVEPVVLSGGFECTACKFLEPLFLGLVNKDKAEIEQTLNNECAVLGELKQLCISFVDSKIDALVAALNKEGANADTICADIGACSKPASRAARVQQSKFDPKCLLCHMLGPELEKLAGKEEPVIQKELDTICERVLGWEHEFAEDCVAFINKEGAMIAKVLAEDNGSGAKELCEKIGWCPSSLVEAKVTNLENPIECDICKALGPELEKLAGQKEPVVVKDLEKVCSKLSFFKDPCDSWVEKEGAMIAKVLTEDEGSSAHILCQKLHMCEAAMVKTETNINVKCDMCAIIGPGLEELAKREEPVVAKDLEHICKVLSFHESWEKACDGYIMKEGDKIAQILTEDSGSGAHELCQKIGWC